MIGFQIMALLLLTATTPRNADRYRDRRVSGDHNGQRDDEHRLPPFA